MNILHVVPTIHNQSAGTTATVLNICKAQSKLGHKVELFTLSSSETFEEIPSKNFTIRYFRRTYFPHFRLGRSKEMYAALMKNENKFDVIHSHLLWMSPCYYAGIAARKNQILYVCSPHGSLTKYVMNRSRLKKKLSLMLGQQRALDAVNAFHVTSEIEKEDLFDLGFGKKIKNIPLGMRANSAKYVRKKRKEIVLLSRIHPKKGIDLLIKAFINIGEKVTNWTLVIAGPVEDKAYFNKISKMSERADNIEIIGPVFDEEKYRFLGEAHLFVLPTHSENFGLVVAEALSCATPVICMTGAPWAALNEENCGWWVPLEELETTLMEAISLTDQQRSQMGERGKEYIEKKFSWDRTGEELCKFYQEIFR